MYNLGQLIDQLPLVGTAAGERDLVDLAVLGEVSVQGSAVAFR